jgi:hypothetical protein
MTDLVDFVRARLDDEENRAVTTHDTSCGMIRYDGTCDCGMPSRALANVDAKRRIIDACRRHESPDTFDLIDDTLRLLALPYASHPDYQEEWRP